MFAQLVSFTAMLATVACNRSEPPSQSIAKASETGPATVIIAGLAVGMFSTVPPVLFIVAAIVASLALSGIYGVALAAVRTSVECPLQ
jgi:K(+)-stimulated pyrophosphate-energized sodium pump